MKTSSWLKKNKFRLQVDIDASSANEIRAWTSMNVLPDQYVWYGRWLVLTENSDYSVDYTMGVIYDPQSNIIDAELLSISKTIRLIICSVKTNVLRGLNFTL